MYLNDVKQILAEVLNLPLQHEPSRVLRALGKRRPQPKGNDK